MRKLLVVLFWGIVSAVFAQPDSAEIRTVAEQMPFFPGCEHYKADDPAKRACSDKALAAFISSRLVYPDSAARRNIEGMVIVSFVVDEQGNPRDMRILRDIGGGCGAEALRVVRAMPKWEPAVQEGRNVPVRLNLPVRFAFKRQLANEGDQFAIHWGKLHRETVSKEDLEKNADETILVRDAYGNLADILELEFLFEKGKKTASAKVGGSVPDKKLRKIIEQTASGGTFTVNAAIQYGNGSLLVSRTFRVQ